MIKIKPIKTWHNGSVIEADTLTARIISDDLQSSCTTYWELSHEGGTVSVGNVTISGDEYEAWDNSNEYLFAYIAKELNIELI